MIFIQKYTIHGNIYNKAQAAPLSKKNDKTQYGGKRKNILSSSFSPLLIYISSTGKRTIFIKRIYIFSLKFPHPARKRYIFFARRFFSFLV